MTIPNSDAYLPPVPHAIRPHKIRHLLALPTPDTQDDPQSWRLLDGPQKIALLQQSWTIWTQLSTHQRNMLVIQLIGWLPDHGTVPLWSTNANLARLLKTRAQDDLFYAEIFAEILYLHLSLQCDFNEVCQTGLPLASQADRAMHYLTLSAREDASDICFAYVLTFRPQDLRPLTRFHTPCPLTPVEAEPV